MLLSMTENLDLALYHQIGLAYGTEAGGLEINILVIVLVQLVGDGFMTLALGLFLVISAIAA